MFTPWAPASRKCFLPSCPAVYRGLLPVRPAAKVNVKTHESIGMNLSQPNPTITNLCIVEKPFYGCRQVPVAQDKISKWHDFSFANIRNAFGDVLDRPLSGSQRDCSDSCEVLRFSELKAFFSTHLSDLVSSSIPDGARLLRQRFGVETPRVQLRRDLDFRSTEGDVVQYKPNVHFCAKDRLQTSLVFGCVRLSGAWHSSYLSGPQSQLAACAVQPIEQLATYASVGDTRYGVVLTDREAVVVRLHCGSGGYGAEWQAVPWSACGGGVLTVRLAVWSLVMMSLNREHRSVRARCDVLPLDVWWKTEDADGVVYRHPLSGRVLSYLPDGATCIDKPEVGAALCPVEKAGTV